MVKKVLMVTCMVVAGPLLALGEHHKDTARTLRGDKASPVRLTSADTVVVYGRESEAVEAIAAREFSRYLKEITGEDIKISSDKDPVPQSKYLILVGRNSILDGLARKGLFDLGSVPEGDGFVIKSVTDSDKNYLILLGGKGRGTIYAVYHYFEEYCDTGYFAEGDRIVKKTAVPFRNISLVEKPRFQERRIDFIPGIYPRGLGGAYWTLEEWKKAFDWMLKIKFNTNHSFLVANIFDMRNEEQLPLYRREIAKEAMKYARERGIEFIFWGGKSDGPGSHYVQDMMKDFGTDHLYTITATERVDLAKGERVAEAYRHIRAVDPETKVVYHDLWDFVAVGLTPEEGKKYLDACPQDIIFGDVMLGNGDPNYKKYNSYWGRKWHIYLVDAMFSQDLPGCSLEGYIRRLKALSEDPAASNCMGIHLSGETNTWWRRPLFAYVLSKLSWNPSEVDEKEIFERYAELRYGKPQAAKMVKSLTPFMEWVSKNLPRGATHQAGVMEFGGDASYSYQEDMNNLQDLDLLRKSLERAVLEKGSLNGDKFYESDLGEVARTYLTRLISKYFIETHYTYKNATNAIGLQEKEKFGPRPGDTVLVKEEFNDDSSLANWEPDSGQWKIANGKLIQKDTTPGYKIILSKDKSFEDFVLKVKYRWVGPPEELGIIWRAKDAKNHLCLLNFGNRATLFKWIDGSYDHITGDVYTKHVLEGENEVVIHAIGDHIKTYLNGYLIIDKECPGLKEKFDRGAVGFKTYRAEVEFDEISMWVPNEKEETKKRAVEMADKSAYQKNLASFQENAGRLELLLDYLSKLYSTRPQFELEGTIAELKKHDDEFNLKDITGSIFADLGGSGGSGPFLAYYHRIGVFEFHHLVYRREVEAYVGELRKRLKEKNFQMIPVGDPVLLGKFRKIEDDFLQKPIHVGRLYSGTTTELTEEILKNTASW